ncbi:hypothetical protein F66182_1457 [Fusarium sp. NRRL 66182]|nr:hypothetical protein F66182_1457 [Fusarium sp. NRRL 66182]
MHFPILALVTAGLASVASAGVAHSSKLSPPYCPPRPVTPQQQRRIFDEFVQKLFIERNPAKAMNDHVSEGYLQHNPFATTGRQPSIDNLDWLTPETVEFTVVHSGVDNNIGFTFTRMDLPGQDQPTAVADFMRFNGSCLVEHWDSIQERPANRTNPVDMW